jgi:hypothetical protein
MKPKSGELEAKLELRRIKGYPDCWHASVRTRRKKVWRILYKRTFTHTLGENHSRAVDWLQSVLLHLTLL